MRGDARQSPHSTAWMDDQDDEVHSGGEEEEEFAHINSIYYNKVCRRGWTFIYLITITCLNHILLLLYTAILLIQCVFPSECLSGISAGVVCHNFRRSLLCSPTPQADIRDSIFLIIVLPSNK